jgi:hypothetical protein
VPGCTASPPNSSRPTTTFAPRLLFPIRHAILTPSPLRGLWSTCIRAVPSAVFPSMASNVHHARPSCTPTRSRPEFAQRELHHALHAAALHVVALHSCALASALPCLSCALLCSAAHALLHPRARICHTLADSLCPCSNRAALYRQFPPSGSLPRASTRARDTWAYSCPG